MLVRVDAPHFVAGLIIGSDGVCTKAAPILRWTIGKTREELRVRFAKMGQPFPSSIALTAERARAVLAAVAKGGKHG